MFAFKLYLVLSCIAFFRSNWACTSSPFGYDLLMPSSCSFQRISMWTGNAFLIYEH